MQYRGPPNRQARGMLCGSGRGRGVLCVLCVVVFVVLVGFGGWGEQIHIQIHKLCICIWGEGG